LTGVRCDVKGTTIQVDTLVCDYALPICVKLSGQSYKDYGFDIFSSRSDMPSSWAYAGFAKDEPRKAAFKKYAVVDNGSSHRGQTSVEWMRRRDKRIVLVHTPIHASWLNQVEIYFSIIQRKALTPNDFENLEAVRVRLHLYEGTEQSHPEAICLEVQSKGFAEVVKTCLAAFFGRVLCCGVETG
jgi:hypothetical protein